MVGIIGLFPEKERANQEGKPIQISVHHPMGRKARGVIVFSRGASLCSEV